MERVVAHCDLNAFYASVECLYRPSIRNKPVAVGGDESSRRGIVLAKNQIAKKYGIQTGESLLEARRKCKELVTVTADMALYTRFSIDFKNILCRYSDAVESFGIDEGWISLTNKGFTIDDGQRVADEIRQRTLDELGISCSVGVSFTKPLAKLASDMLKPNGTVIITKDNFREKAWPLPVFDLLFVGPSRTKTLLKYGICSIGDLANADPELLRHALGKVGLMIQSYARGDDTAPVRAFDAVDDAHSIGNSSTLRKDATSLENVRNGFAILADSVSYSLRENGFRSRCIHIGVRKTDLSWQGCQRTIKMPTCLSIDLLRVAMELFTDRRYEQLLPLRGLDLRCTQLSPVTAPIQTDMFFDITKHVAREELEKTVRKLQDRYGTKIVQRGIMMADKEISSINPKDHIAPSAPYKF
jgi:DNA polymerase-4